MWAPLPSGRGAFWGSVTGNLMEMLDFARLQSQLRRTIIWPEESMIRVASTSTRTDSPEKNDLTRISECEKISTNEKCEKIVKELSATRGIMNI